jgi:hypothetical protein
MPAHAPDSDPTPPPEPRRSASTWFKLLAIWFVGLIVWTLYLGVITILVFQILS